MLNCRDLLVLPDYKSLSGTERVTAFFINEELPFQRDHKII